MKLLIVGDMHLGVRNASQIVSNFQLKFFEEQVFPYMEKHGITTILQTGDLCDTRKFSNHVILEEWKRRFFDAMQKKKIEFKMFLGNHDIALKNTLSVNTPSLFLSQYDNVTIYDKITEENFDGLSMLIVPWICQQNYTEAVEALDKSKSLWCAGHFEFDGFDMHKGQTHTGGIKAPTRFEQMISGHFHTRSTKGNVTYVGTPYEMTWIDYGDPKGFHVLDTDTRELKFVQNDFTLFNKVYYNDKDQKSDYFKSIKLDHIEETYVKVIVTNKTDPYQFDRFMDKIFQIPTADLKIVEDMSEFETDNIDDDDLELEDTPSLISSFIDAVDTELDKDKLKTAMKSLYVESLHTL